MSVTIVTLSSALGVLLCLFSVSVYYNFKHGIILLKVQDAIEESLDVLDEKYDSMTEILEMPIFFDSVEVRRVISDISDSRASILDIARKLTTSLGESEESREEESA